MEQLRFMYTFSAEKKKNKVFALRIIFTLPDGEFVQRKRRMRMMGRVKKRVLNFSFRNA